MNPNMNSNACAETTAVAQYMDNKLQFLNIGYCYVNLFSEFPKSDGKAFEDPVRTSIESAIKLFGNHRLIQIKTYDDCFYFQLEMED